MSQENNNFDSDLEFEIELEQSLEQALSPYLKHDKEQLQDMQKIYGSSQLKENISDEELCQEIDNYDQSDDYDEKDQSGVNLNKLCFINTKTLRDALEGEELVQSNNNSQEPIEEEQEELSVQESSEGIFVTGLPNQNKFKLDLNFEFKDDLQEESERDLIQKEDKLYNESLYEDNYQSQDSQSQDDGKKINQPNQLDYKKEVPQKVSGQLQIVKRNAERMKKKSFIASVSCEPNVKDAKSKVQSFNTNYLKPKFLKQKSRDSSQISSSSKTKSRPVSALKTAEAVSDVKKIREERPPLVPINDKKYTIKVEPSSRKTCIRNFFIDYVDSVKQKFSDLVPQIEQIEAEKPKEINSLAIKTKIDSNNFSSHSIKNLRTKYSSLKVSQNSKQKVEIKFKEHESIGVIKMKFKNEKGEEMSKYKQKRQSVVEINRIQLKLNQLPAKPQVGFESPRQYVKRILPLPQKESPVVKQTEVKYPRKSSQMTVEQPSLLGKSNTQKQDEQNFESGEDGSQKSINKKKLTDLELGTNSTIDCHPILTGQSVAKLITSDNKENIALMEQTFKPQGVDVRNQQTSMVGGEVGNFYKSNTYLKMTGKTQQQSSTFNTIAVETSQILNNFTPKQAPQPEFKSLKVDRDASHRIASKNERAASHMKSITSSVQKNKQIHRKTQNSTQRNECVPILDGCFEQERQEYLKVIEDLRCLLQRPQPLTPVQKERQIATKDSKNMTTEPSNSKSQQKEGYSATQLKQEDTKKRQIFDMRLKSEVNEIRLHLKDSSKSSAATEADGCSHVKWLSTKLKIEKSKNDKFEKEIKKVLEIKKLTV